MARRRRKETPMKVHENVIRLEDRGPERVLKGAAWTFGILGVLCVLYCAAIGLFLGYGSYFFLNWGAMGAGFGVIALFCAKPAWRRKIPKWLLRLFWACFCIAAVLFCLVEGLILSKTNANAEDGADYLMVLGAQWKTSGPSKVLQYRLDKAVHYLRVNPGTKVIVTGGQGANEPISEAEGMYNYLVAAGIDGARIMKEDKSTNTYENFAFSGNMIDRTNASVVIVTNGFHCFRAEKLAKAQGYGHVQMLAADSYPPMEAHNLFREFFGVVKDFLLGNMVYWEQG